MRDRQLKKYSIQPQFIDGIKGRLYCNYFESISNKNPHHAILILPPFAEEMNKSRRMLANIARMSAEQGYNAFCFDLFGTGDSQGDFGDSTWEIWLNDVSTILRCLKEKNIDTITVISLRSGSLFIESILQNSLLTLTNIILWQPVISGSLFMNQFIRLKLAADMIGDSANRTSAKIIKQQFKNGDSVEIAGYMINAALFNPMEKQNLSSIKQAGCPDIHWFEVAPSLEQTFSPASMRVIDGLKDAEINIHMTPVQGAQFWTTSEIAEVSTLLNKTLDILKGTVS